MLEHLNQFQSALDRIEDILCVLNERAADLEMGQTSIIQQLDNMVRHSPSQETPSQ